MGRLRAAAFLLAAAFFFAATAFFFAATVFFFAAAAFFLTATFFFTAAAFFLAAAAFFFAAAATVCLTAAAFFLAAAAFFAATAAFFFAIAAAFFLAASAFLLAIAAALRSATSRLRRRSASSRSALMRSRSAALRARSSSSLRWRSSVFRRAISRLRSCSRTISSRALTRTRSLQKGCLGSRSTSYRCAALPNSQAKRMRDSGLTLRSTARRMRSWVVLRGSMPRRRRRCSSPGPNARRLSPVAIWKIRAAAPPGMLGRCLRNARCSSGGASRSGSRSCPCEPSQTSCNVIRRCEAASRRRSAPTCGSRTASSSNSGLTRTSLKSRKSSERERTILFAPSSPAYSVSTATSR